jgi:hypothetical protein
MSTRRLLLLAGVVLLALAAALFIRGTNSPVSAQDGEGECDGPCPDWIVDAWSGSGHADATAEAFRHWDNEDVKEVPVACAKCHSETGYLDYLGADGSAAGSVEVAAGLDTVVSCTVCHNPVATVKTSVMFPSGIELADVGPAARCMECHQGRASTVQVNAKITELALGPDDVSADLGFINVHYFAAAASLLGGEVQGGYQYEGNAYQPRLGHVPEFNTCNECHNPHSLELEIEKCATCHVGVASVEDLQAIRMPTSMVDHDGDGDVAEGMHSELEGLQETLYAAIQAYAANVAGSPIAYDAVAYPYFFIDTNANGTADPDEANFGNKYASFTPRLLEAAYNFQFYEKDPGAFAHNPRYHAELMYDSIMSLNEALPTPMEVALQRNPPGHFDGSGEAFRHWDADGEVPGSCVKCHTAEGLPMFVKNNATIAVEPSVSLTCSTCHASLPEFTLLEVAEVRFPSGAVLAFPNDAASNLCLNCHQGRESTVSVNRAITGAGVGDDEVSDKLTFRNIHYFAAGASLFGGEAQGAYQYEGKEYVGRFQHVPGAFETCKNCHDVHLLKPQVTQCATCHAGVTEFEQIRMASGDFDGDGADEGVAGEIETYKEKLLAAIQAYATNTAGAAIAYNPARHPYWFIDANANGVADPDEGDRYATWTPTLLRAAYNYQYASKDPGAFVHNAKYIVQTLYDSLEAVDGADAVAGMTRP